MNNQVTELFISTKERIDTLSAATVEPLAVSFLQLERDSRLRFLQQKLSDKLNETCMALCLAAKSLDTSTPLQSIKLMYDQMRMVIKARHILDEHIVSSNRLLSRTAGGKLVVENEVNAVMRTKLAVTIAHLQDQYGSEESDLVQEYGEYCYYLAGYDESDFDPSVIITPETPVNNNDQPDQPTSEEDTNEAEEKTVKTADKQPVSKRVQVMDTIRSKLVELRIDDEDDLHDQLIEAVLGQGLTAGLEQFREHISASKFRKLEQQLEKLDLNTSEDVPAVRMF